jgi:RNA chaperone Hfq
MAFTGVLRFGLPGNGRPVFFWGFMDRVQLKDFDCCNPFLDKVRRSEAEVEVFLTSGICLLGYIRKFDSAGIVFFGGPRSEPEKEQLIFRTSIMSIVPMKET